MPGVAFKAMEPKGKTFPVPADFWGSDGDSHAGDSDEHDYSDHEEEIAPYDTSLMRYGSVHIRDVGRDVSPTTLSRYQTFGSVHIEDIMPTPTADLERLESAHIDDLGQYIQGSVQAELRTKSRSRSKSKSKSRSRSKSKKESSKESKTKSQSRTRSGSKPKKTKEPKDGSKSSRKSKKKSKASKEKSSLYPSPLEVQQSMTFCDMNETTSSSSSSNQQLYPSNESIMADPWQSSSKLLEQIDHDQFALLEEQRHLLENIDNSKQIESITQGMTPSERDAFLREQNELYEKIAQNDQKLAAMDLQRSKLTNAPRSPPSKSIRRKQPKHSSPPPKPQQVEECLQSLNIDKSILNTMDQEAFLREQQELLEQIAQNDQKLAAMDAQQSKKAPQPPSPSKRSGRKPAPPQRSSLQSKPQPLVEECLSSLQIDQSLLDAMDPYERKVFVEEQQQAMEKMRREKAAEEADARFARELAAQQEMLSSIYPSIYPSACAKSPDDGTFSTCTPSSLGTQESDHSFETLPPSWATSVVDPPVYYK